MHRNEMGVLRTQLRDLNIEYSALVRAAGGDEARSVRMAELKARRGVLMARIAEAGPRAPVHAPAAAFPAAAQAQLEAVVQAA
jgi:hypothetical protein